MSRYNQQFNGSLVIVSLALLLPVLMGCADKSASNVVPVEGKVLLDGQPLAFGTVTFQPNSGQPARGEIQSDGTFKLSTYAPNDGATVGRHQVRITCYESQSPDAKDSLESESLGASLIPERYTKFATSGLVVSIVSSGTAPFEFNLESEEFEDDLAEVDLPEIDDESQSPPDMEETPDEQAEPSDAAADNDDGQ